MEVSIQLTDSNDRADHRDGRYYHHHRQHHHQRGGTLGVDEIGDDECSTDSGCSNSGGGSTGSGEHLSSRRGSDEGLCKSGRAHCYLERLWRRSTRSFNDKAQRSLERSWSPPEHATSLPRVGVNSLLSYSFSLSDAHSGSDSDSLKRPLSTAETLLRAFRNLNITSSSKMESNKEQKHGKKSPKRILRSPVPYIYVRGLSGIPTRRVPRQQQTVQFYSCQDLIGLYR